jgi:branched-chain amino acid transport system permease protein
VLNGFLTADRGTMRFAGQEIGKLKPHEVCARGVGRTFQVVRSFPRMTVLENVVIGAFVGSKTDDEAERLAMEALARVGMADHQAHMLAGGSPRGSSGLMELARALAPKPRPSAARRDARRARAERARRRAAGDPPRQPRRASPS